MALARTILVGFQRHFSTYQAVTAAAAERFANGAWQAVYAAASERIEFYDLRVAETTQALAERLGTSFTQASAHAQRDACHEALWLEVKTQYRELLRFHPQAELAETFYNSVFCRLFHRRYFNNAFIFVDSVLQDGPPLALESEYRSYFPVVTGVRHTLQTIIADMQLQALFADLSADIKLLRLAFRQQLDGHGLASHQMRIDVLKGVFYRNKAAYIVGRIVTHSAHGEVNSPFIVPVLRNPQGLLQLDALITDVEQMAIIFGFARNYFMVSTRVPSALVRFLQNLMPRKTLAELYSAIGFHKQGKTEFYREFLQHLSRSDDQLVSAPGIKGLVMTVFMLPSFPYVFKVIKDNFGGTKSMTRQTVIDRYRMVKRHDRGGRMADTLEFADVALPLARIAPDLLEELKATVGQSLRYENDTLVIKQLFVERRMTPLNLYLQYADAKETEAALADYGQALKDMLAANIFPGDMLLKNFGVTRHGRVVFYDYDEVRPLLEMNFRPLSESANGAGPDDVFPEQLTTFAVVKRDWRELLLKHHPELVQVDFWRQQQQHIRAGVVTDVFPYGQQLRFKRDA